MSQTPPRDRAEDAAPVVQVRDLTFAYPTRGLLGKAQEPVLHDISLDVHEQEIVGLVGESGSGKSTIGRILLGLVRVPDRTRFIDGQPTRGRAAAGMLGAVLQNPAASFDPHYTVGVSISEPLRILGRGTTAERAAQVRDLLELVGLDPELADRRPGELSGGQRQRASIARALITRPRFVLFDEAVSALDVSVQAQVLGLIRELKVSQSLSAVFISHDLGATRYVSDRIIVLRQGRIVDEGDAADFYQPRTEEYSRSLQVASGL